MTIIRSIAALLCVAALAACEKNAVQDITGPLPASRIKFFNFGIGSPAVHFYANDTKMTATSVSTCTPPTNPQCTTTGLESTAGVTYSNVAAAGYYLGIEAAQYTFSGRITDTIPKADKDLTISRVTATIEDGRYYSFYQSGIYNTATKSADAFVVEDLFPEALDYSTAHVRFVNAIHNSEPMVLFARDTATKQEYPIGGPVAYKSTGAFVAVPPGQYDLVARAPGSNTALIVRNTTTTTGGIVAFSAPRVYTIAARGNMTVSTGTAADRAFLDNTTNR